MARRLDSRELFSLPAVFAMMAGAAGCTGFVSIAEDPGVAKPSGSTSSSSSGVAYSSSSSSGTPLFSSSSSGMVSTSGSSGTVSTSGSSGTVSTSGSSGTVSTSGSSGTVSTSSSSGMVASGIPLGLSGYLVDPPWQGFAFTFNDGPMGSSTINPVCGSNGCTPALTSLCASGVVAAQPDYSGFAGLGWSLNQTALGETATWTVAGSGVNVVLNGTYPEARIQFDELDALSSSQRYCASIPPGGGFIPFSNIMSYCWGDVTNPSKPLTAGTAVGHAEILIPGTALSPIPFDFCITALSVVP